MNRRIGVIFSYILMAAEIFSAMLFTPFLIRSLGQSEYGVYQLVSSITSYLALLELGVSNAIVRYMAKYRANNDMQKQREVLGIAIVFFSSIAMFILLAGAVFNITFPYAFSEGLSVAEIAIARKLLVINVINVAITIGTSPYSATLDAYEQFAFTQGVYIITLLV